MENKQAITAVLEAQQAIIGLLMKGEHRQNAAFEEILKQIDEECFVLESAQENLSLEAFRIFKALEKEGREFTINTLEEKAAELCEPTKAEAVKDHCLNMSFAAGSERKYAVAHAEKLIQYRAEKTAKDETQYRKSSAANLIGAFLKEIKESADTPCFSTGFEKIDKVLDGGLYPGLYFIGAISSLGKTTLALQMCDSIARQGHDVIVFSLEMARTELIAKSLSRNTLTIALDVYGGENAHECAKTAREISDGKRHRYYTEEDKGLFMDAIADYKTYAEHLFLEEGIGDIGVAQIRERVQRHVKLTGRAPVVLIDYLQILAPYNEKMSDKQNTDHNVMELKRLSRDFKTPVIGISSLNRMSYKDPISMESFKESGAIEYSSDVLIGLQLKGAANKDFDPTAAKKKYPREIEMVILKNRNYKTGDVISLAFYPKYNYFTDTVIPINQPEPPVQRARF